MLIRAQTLAALMDPKPQSRAEMSTGVQLVTRGRMSWSHKAMFPRNAPYTVGPWAHDGQLQIRIAFAKAARKAKGKEGLDPKYGLPWAARFVKDELTGKKMEKSMEPEEYPSKIKRTAFTVAHLIAEAKDRGIPVPELE